MLMAHKRQFRQVHVVSREDTGDGRLPVREPPVKLSRHKGQPAW